MLRPTRRHLVFAAAAVVVLAGLVLFAWREFAIDRCLDHGGRWDEQENRCDMGEIGAS